MVVVVVRVLVVMKDHHGDNIIPCRESFFGFMFLIHI